MPPVRKSFDIAPKTNKPMQVEQMIHSILRLDNEHKPIPPKEETVGSFAFNQNHKIAKYATF